MRTILAILLLTGATSAWAGPLQDGAHDFQRADYRAAQAAWYPLALQGNAVAQNNLGGLYRDGKGVPRDYAKAARWFAAAAAQGNSAGMYNLGLMLERGQGMNADPLHAYMWYALAAERHDIPNAVAHREAMWNRMAPALQKQALAQLAACKSRPHKICR
jgi:TPR repeat protein